MSGIAEKHRRKIEELAARLFADLDLATIGYDEATKQVIMNGAVISCANTLVRKAKQKDAEFADLIAEAFRDNIEKALAGEFDQVSLPEGILEMKFRNLFVGGSGPFQPLKTNKKDELARRVDGATKDP